MWHLVGGQHTLLSQTDIHRLMYKFQFIEQNKIPRQTFKNLSGSIICFLRSNYVFLDRRGRRSLQEEIKLPYENLPFASCPCLWWPVGGIARDSPSANSRKLALTKPIIHTNSQLAEFSLPNGSSQTKTGRFCVLPLFVVTRRRNRSRFAFGELAQVGFDWP